MPLAVDYWKAEVLNAVRFDRQVRKQKTKLERKMKDYNLRFDTLFDNTPEPEDEELKIVRTKKFTIKPMPAEEAAMQMELLGHSFFVFSNSETEEVNVIYKRKDGNYGLIEQEF